MEGLGFAPVVASDIMLYVCLYGCVGVCVFQLWLKMSVDSEKRCVLLPRETRTSCVFHTAEEKDEIPGVGEDR